MTIGSHELALTIINDGAGYTERCRVAALPAHNAVAAQCLARTWLQIAVKGGQAYERQFGTPATASSFSPEDILLAAAELADYYETHCTEALAS